MILTLCFSFLLIYSSYATEIYVGLTNSSIQNGSFAFPYSDLNAAFTQATTLTSNQINIYLLSNNKSYTITKSYNIQAQTITLESKF